MRWAVAFHPEQITTLSNGRCRLTVPPLQIAESSVQTAVEQGWIVIGTDSEVLSEPIPERTMDMKLLSNPRRDAADPGDD